MPSSRKCPSRRDLLPRTVKRSSDVSERAIGVRRLSRHSDPIMSVDLKPLTEADVPLVLDWLSRPHVAPWWSQPSDKADLDYLLASGHDRGYLIASGGRPVGFIQAYNCYA